MATETLSFALKWKPARTSVETMEPNDFVYETEGDIVSVDEYEQEELVGKFRLYYVDVAGGFNEGWSPLFGFDGLGETICI